MITVTGVITGIERVPVADDSADYDHQIRDIDNGQVARVTASKPLGKPGDPVVVIVWQSPHTGRLIA